MTKNKQTAIWTTVAVVMIIIGVATFVKQRPRHASTKAVTEIHNQAQVATPASDVANTSTATSTLTTGIVTTGSPNPIPSKALSYGEAVAKYADHRIQFNDDCQGIPGQVFFANGITIMLDNRAGIKRRFSIAGKVYNVTAYGYTLATLKQKTLPAKLRVDCDSHMNAVEIIVE